MGTRRSEGELLGIGEFAELSGLSVDMLRRYHDLGLLEPADVAPTGYRRYTLGQVERARAIAALRAVDLPLDDIAVVLRTDDPHLRFEVLHRHRARLAADLRAATRRVEDLDRLINQEAIVTTDLDKGLRAELLEMFEAQQQAGRELFEQTRHTRPDRFLFELDPSDRPASYDAAATQARRHAARLDEIISKHGWPTAGVVGDDGAAAAWSLAQHADEDNELCKRWLPLLRAAVDRAESPALHYAALSDRIRIRVNQPQVYGTVVEPTESGWRSRPPVDREAELNARRAEIGLEPIEVLLGALPAPDAWYAGQTTTA